MPRRYPLLLLVLSVAVLAAGTLMRRRAADPKPAAPAIDLEILQRLTADRRLRDLSGYLSGKAHAAARGLLPSGLVWDAHTVLAPGTGRDLPFTVRRENSNLPAAVPVRPRPGDWLIAVARDAAGEPVFAHGLFEGVAKERCGSFDYDAVHFAAPLAPTMIGGGLFTLDGGLAAFLAGCHGRPIAIASATVADFLARPVTPADLLEQQYGYRLAQDPPGLVTSVWQGSLADAAGIRPGDVVDPAARPPSVAKRRGRSVRLDWPENPPEPPLHRGISFERSAVAAVAPGSPAEAAGIVAGDVIERIDGASVTDPAHALDRARGPVVVTVRRNGRRRETLLQP